MPSDKRYLLTVVTACSPAYFDSALTLIASVHRTSMDQVDRILVYDVGLRAEQRAILEKLMRVEVRGFPEAPYDTYMQPIQKSYKPYAIWDAGRESIDVLWLDAGAMLLKSVTPIQKLLSLEGIWLTRLNPDITNGEFCSNEARDLLQLTDREASSYHLASGHIGYRSASRWDAMFEEAWELSKVKGIMQFPYPTDGYGEDGEKHRRDQLLYSVLALRYHCPTWPLHPHPLGLENAWWVHNRTQKLVHHRSGAIDGNPSMDQIRSTDVVVYVHRRTLLDHSGLLQGA